MVSTDIVIPMHRHFNVFRLLKLLKDLRKQMKANVEVNDTYLRTTSS